MKPRYPLRLGRIRNLFPDLSKPWTAGLLALVSTGLFISPGAWAQLGPCESAFITQSQATLALVDSNAFAQWQKWEREANVKMHRIDKAKVAIPFSGVARSEVDIQTIGAFGDLPQNLREFLFHGENVIWPHHPFNQSANVPFLNLEKRGTLRGAPTASRSLVLEKGSFLRYSIKLPTDTVHENLPGLEGAKIRTEDDIGTAITRATYIQARDRRLGPDPSFAILFDSLTVADKRTGRGFLLRDLSRLDDGHYYLPAFAIPWVGREIAAHNGTEFSAFWQKHYAEAIGAIKARLLVRYGLQMESPNAQNFLIQLDRNLRPTGLILIRDISDTRFVDIVAKGLDVSDLILIDVRNGAGVDFNVEPFWQNTFMYFDQAHEIGRNLSVPNPTLRSWGKAHNQAFTDQLTRETGLPFQMGAYENAAYPVYRVFETEEGQAALKRLR